MWDSLLDAFGWLLSVFYSVVPSYGVAIILLTITVRLLLYPLTAKQARSMAAMQRVQPEIKKLQAKYKHDRQKLNEELMAFYKEHQINPLAGCLPLVAQFPIFIALFQVLRSPAKHTPEGSTLFEAFCNGATAAECEPRGLQFLGMDLSQNAGAAGGFLDAFPYLVLIGLVIASGYLQSRQMSSLQKGRSSNPQMQMMTKIMPVFFGLISYSLPAGVVVYFLTSNLWQIGQQALVFGRDGGPGATDKQPSKGKVTGKAAVKEADTKPPAQVEAGDTEAPEAAPNGASGRSGTGGSTPPKQKAAQHPRSRKKKRKRRR